MASLGAAVGVTTCGPMVTLRPTGPTSGGRGGRGGTPSRPNAKTPRRNTKDEIRNTKDQIRNTNAEFDQIRNTNAEFDQIRNANLIRPNTKYEIRNMKYEIRNMKYEIRNTKYEMRILDMIHEPVFFAHHFSVHFSRLHLSISVDFRSRKKSSIRTT